MTEISEKRKEQLKKAQSKFMQVSTKLNETEAYSFNLKKGDRTVSGYLKELISGANEDKSKTTTLEENRFSELREEKLKQAINQLQEQLKVYEARTPLEEIVRSFKRLLGKE